MRRPWVTSQGIYYLQIVDAHTEVLLFWNTSTKQDSALARITGRLAGALSASQDDRFALLVKNDQGDTDLMLVEDFQ